MASGVCSGAYLARYVLIQSYFCDTLDWICSLQCSLFGVVVGAVVSECVVGCLMVYSSDAQVMSVSHAVWRGIYPLPPHFVSSFESLGCLEEVGILSDFVLLVLRSGTVQYYSLLM